MSKLAKITKAIEFAPCQMNDSSSFEHKMNGYWNTCFLFHTTKDLPSCLARAIEGVPKNTYQLSFQLIIQQVILSSSSHHHVANLIALYLIKRN